MRATLALVPRASRVAASLLTVLLLAGCESDMTQPTPAEPRALVHLSRDAGTDAFTLMTLQAGTSDRPIPVALIGQNLRVDDGYVALDVAIANQSEDPLSVTGLWLWSIQPLDVVPQNADLVPPPVRRDVLRGPIWGFNYSTLQGEDEILAPGETSGAKEWRFQSSGTRSFSFAAQVDIADRGRGTSQISGLVFWDANVNGRHERGEELLAAGSLRLEGPNRDIQETHVGADARYTFVVDAPGLYAVHFLGSPFASPLPFVLTTPNPLQVVLLSNASSGVQSFDAAHFGARPFPTHPAAPIQLTDRPPDAIRQDHYQLTDFALVGSVLRTRVGFSGCSPDHPLQLYMSGGFMESHPVQARIVLMHDDRGELCDAAWSIDREWDLSPIVRLYAQQYGSRTGSVILHLVRPNGDVHEVRLEF